MPKPKRTANSHSRLYPLSFLTAHLTGPILNINSKYIANQELSNIIIITQEKTHQDGREHNFTLVLALVWTILTCLHEGYFVNLHLHIYRWLQGNNKNNIEES